MRSIIIAIALIFSTVAPGITDTGDKDWLGWFKPFNAKLRIAVDYLRTENLDFAALSLEELLEDTPPSGLPPSLVSPATSAHSKAEAALAQIDEGNGQAARDILLELRQSLFDTNRANKFEIFDDCIWSVRKAGSPLWHYRRNKPDFADAKQREEVAAATSNYLAQLEQCDAIAPVEIRDKEDWKRVALDAMTSLHRIKSESIANNDVGQLIRFIRELRSFDNLLYARYG